MTAYLPDARLRRSNKIPLLPSLTFEQSYSEVDGDSANGGIMCAHQRAYQCASESKTLRRRLGRSVWSRATGGWVKRKIEGFFAIRDSGIKR